MPTIPRSPIPKLALAAAVLCAGVNAARAQAPQVGPDLSALAAAELIVKFREGSSLARATAAAAGDPRSDRGLADELARLTRELSVVLRPKRVTSGGELVLELDRAALGRTIATRLGERPEIAAATPVEEPERVRPAPTLAVRLEPAAGVGEAGIERALAAVSRELGATLALEPPAAGEPARAVLAVGPLLARVQSFLREHPEVDYSQLDRIVAPYGAS